MKADSPELHSLEHEIQRLQARLVRVQADQIQALRERKAKLMARVETLQNQLLQSLLQTRSAPTREELGARVEILRQAAADYFSRTEIDTELWKSTVS